MFLQHILPSDGENFWSCDPLFLVSQYPEHKPLNHYNNVMNNLWFLDKPWRNKTFKTVFKKQFGASLLIFPTLLMVALTKRDSTLEKQ